MVAKTLITIVILGLSPGQSHVLKSLREVKLYSPSLKLIYRGEVKAELTASELTLSNDGKNSKITLKDASVETYQRGKPAKAQISHATFNLSDNTFSFSSIKGAFPPYSLFCQSGRGKVENHLWKVNSPCTVRSLHLNANWSFIEFDAKAKKFTIKKGVSIRYVPR